jgi:protein O-mannosyl-transferase
MSKHKKNRVRSPSSSVVGASFASRTSFPFWAWGILATLVFIVYLPSLNGGFIWDDKDLLTQNPLIKASDGLYRLWCTTETIDYWPMTYTTFWFEWRLWGMNSNGYHVTNVILHILCCLLIWAILRKLSVPGAYLAVLLFAVHPVNVESVAWIAQRKNLLAMVFFLMSILAYLQFEDRSPLSRRGSMRWYGLSLMAFLLAMLSKGSVAVMPLLLLLILWWRRPLTWRDLLWMLPFFAVAAILTGVNIWFQTHGTGEVIRNASGGIRLLGAGGVVWFYLFKAVFPWNLSFVYPQWQIQVNNPMWWLPLFAVGMVTVVLWRYRNGWGRPLLFAWGFFCIALLPVMGLIDVYFMKFSLVADHYQHLALVAPIALAASLWSVWRDRTQKSNRWSMHFVAFLVLILFALQTWRQNGYYRNEIALYEATLRMNPSCPMAYYNLGVALVDEDRWLEAKERFAQALKLKPDYFEAYNNLGNVLALENNYQEAIYQYRQALRIKPEFPRAHNNLGSSLLKLGRVSDAIFEFKEAVRCDPDYLNAYMNLSQTAAAAGQSEEAINAMEKALTIARTKGETETIATLENWLKSYHDRGN